MKEYNIFNRHTVRADGKHGLGKIEDSKDIASAEFPSITVKGVEKAREIARNEYRETIEKMDSDGILFIGGSSEEKRTSQTAEVIGEELAVLYEDNRDVLVLSRKEIEKIKNDTDDGRERLLEKIKKIIDENSEKKIVVTYPMFLKEFSLKPGFRDVATGGHSEYSKALFNKVGYDEKKAAIEWFSNNGGLEKDGFVIEGPQPQLIAKRHEEGFKRLRDFARELCGKRQLSIGIVGHGWNLDALALYYANGGSVDRESFRKLFDDENIEQAEVGIVEINDGETTLYYKGSEFKN